MTGLLRKKLGFDEVIFTDALSMNAIRQRYGPAEAAVRAAAACRFTQDRWTSTEPSARCWQGRWRRKGWGILRCERPSKRLSQLARRYPPDPALYDPT